jgi:hypothetical protein
LKSEQWVQFALTGNPGPFAELKRLQWSISSSFMPGDIATTRSARISKFRPMEWGVLQHKELDWVMLITCQDYDEARGKYRWRRAVRAVLVSIEEE